MILRRWIVEWLQDSSAAPVIEGVETFFQLLFRGVIDAYQVAEENVNVAPETFDLVLSSVLTLVYIAGVVAILFFGMNTITWLKKQLTGSEFGTRTKLGIAAGIWIALTAIDTVANSRLFVWEMTQENAEWIYVSRQIITRSVDVEVGIEIVAFGFFHDPNLEVFAMTTIALLLISNLAYQYVPAATSAVKLFVPLFAAKLLAIFVAPRFQFEVFPIDLWPVFVGHVLFAWLVLGTVLAWILGTVFRVVSDFFAGKRGYFARPDLIKYTRDGTVLFAIFLSLVSVSYTAVLGLLAWFSYKLAMDKDVLEAIFGNRSSKAHEPPSGDNCEWDDSMGELVCESGD